MIEPMILLLVSIELVSVRTVNIPDDGADLNGSFSSKDIRNEARHKSTKPGTTGHGGGDATLHIGVRPNAFIAFALVEVAVVLVCSENGGHGRNVETEEATSNHRNSGDQVDVADLIHGDGAASSSGEYVCSSI